MYYWNQYNFEGLKEIAQAYRQRKGYEDFSSYCLLREKGLKKQALQALAKFIDRCHSASLDEQYQVARDLSLLKYENPEVNQLLAFPLSQYLIEIFERLVDAGKADVEVYRWLGYLYNDSEYYKKALQCKPDDQISLTNLAESYLFIIDYMTHHLYDSRLLGDVEQVEQSLLSCVDILMRLEPGDKKTELLQDYNYYKALIRAWKEYSQLATPLAFSDWCFEKGYDFIFFSSIYFEP